MSPFAAQYAEVLSRISSLPTLICDRDHIIAVEGVSKKEYLERRITPALEDIMESRKNFTLSKNNAVNLHPVEGMDHAASIVYPIIAAGDVTGAVIMLSHANGSLPTETEIKLVHTAAAFLGKQMEE